MCVWGGGLCTGAVHTHGVVAQYWVGDVWITVGLVLSVVNVTKEHPRMTSAVLPAGVCFIGAKEFGHNFPLFNLHLAN